MNKIVIAAALIGTLAATGSAFAQGERIRPNERYCLETNTGGRGGGGAGTFLCRFVSWEQCMASRTTPGDRCMLNPYLVGQPIR